MSTYSSNLRIELITNGTQAGTWGDTTNGNLAYVLDSSIAGYQTVSVISSNQALTYTNGPTSTATANQAVYAMLRFTTTTVSAFNVYAPPNSKAYIIWNNSGYSMTIYNSTVAGNTTAAGTGITIADGKKVMVFSDATNFYTIDAANLTGTLAIANGGTGQTTANAALNALLPSQTGNANRYLQTNGSNTSWDAVDISTADVTGTLAIANGGTNATTAAGARTNLGLGTMATQSSGSVSITGGTITGITDLAVADGGTGASDAATARSNLGLVIGTNVPSPTGTGASGTWAINISGNANTATNATSASSASFATNATYATSAGSATNATNVTGTVAIANGGTGQTTVDNAGSALGVVGVGQSWSDVTSSRALSTTYTNNTGRPIMVYVSALSGIGGGWYLVVSGISFLQNSSGNAYQSASVIVPNGNTYSVTVFGSVTLSFWGELR